MLSNRSMPACSVIPVLGYPDVEAAVEWLTRTFGLVERWRAGGHRAQLAFGDGAIAVARRDTPPQPDDSVMLRVDDVDAHFAHAKDHGARIVQEPEDHFYGERQYTVEDLVGRQWTFSQSIADVAPEDWGAVSHRL